MKYTKAEIKAKAKKSLNWLIHEAEKEAEEYIAKTNQPTDCKYAYLSGMLKSELKCRLTEIIEEF